MLMVAFKRLDKDLPMLTKAYPYDACYDVYNRKDTVIPPYHGAHVDFGFSMAIPEDYEGQIRSRSGWTRKGIYIIHGTIDSNYRGEIGCHVFNGTGEFVTLPRGAKIAQFGIRPVPKISFYEAEDLGKTDRQDSGFGSSGM